LEKLQPRQYSFLREIFLREILGERDRRRDGMEFFDLKNISERYMELINPVTPEKILTIGKFLRRNSNG